MSMDEHEVSSDPVEQPDEVSIDEATLDDAIERADTTVTDVSGTMQSLVEWLVEQLVDDTDGVTVDADQRGNMVLVRVRLPEEQLGKVIGRGGRIAKSIRGALGVAGARHRVRVSLDIEEQNAPA